MVAYLTKSDASEGFTQIIDFLNESSIKYTLTVNPNIYVLCIKQFWTTVAVKKVNDVTRLHALVDKKKLVVTEARIRDALRLDDTKGVECLPNEEIFTELARMGYEKPSTKLTFYKVFFSSQWKFLIHTILQYMSAKRTSWNEFSSSMASVVICLSTEQQVDKGDADVNVGNVSTAGVAAEGDVSAANDDVPTAVEEPSPTPPTQSPPSQDIPSTSQHKQLKKRNKLKVLKLRRLKKVGSAQRIDTSDDTMMDDVSNQGRMIVDMDVDADVVLEEANDVAGDIVKYEEEIEPAKLQEVVDVVTTAKIITKVVTAASDTITTASTTITAVDAQVPTATLTAAPSRVIAAPCRRRKGVVIRDPQETATPSIIIHSKAKSKDKGKGILVEEPKPLNKQAQIEQDKKYARELEAELNKNIDWDKAIDHVQRKQKEDKAVKRYQALKRKPQTEAQAKKNTMIYLRNVAGFKIDYFKGMSYDDISPIFVKKFNSNVAFLMMTNDQINEEESRALKRLNESKKDKALKKQELDEEVEDLKRHLQILTNEEDDVYTEATPLALKIITFTTAQLILLVERRYPLTRFILDQMLNNVRLKVEEENEVSLELLRSAGVKGPHMSSSKDVYSRKKIIAVTKLLIMKKYDYRHLQEIEVRQEDQKLYKFREGDFQLLRLQDIKDMLLLLAKQKLTNLTIDERSNLRNRTTYTAYSDPKGVIYKDQMNRNRMIRADELHKLSDGMLNDVRSALHDIPKGIRMKYLPKRKWCGLHKRRAWVMI
nr:hypothetical protein [Tanacetum cinerariifolium]